MYYHSGIFTSCVDRKVPHPSILYWRVRAVYAMYGPMKDGKSGKTLFNKKALTKAKNVLVDI